MLKNISVRTVLRCLLAAVTALLLIVGSMGLTAVNRGNNAMEDMERIQTIIIQLYSSNSNLFRARATAASVIHQIESNQREEAIKNTSRVASYIKHAQTEMDKFIKSDIQNPRGKELAALVVSGYEEYMKKGIYPLLRALENQDVNAYYRLLESSLSSTTSGYQQAVETFNAYGDQVSDAGIEQSKHNERIMKISFSVCGVIALILIVSGWTIVRAILIKPLRSAMEYLEHIATGDLTQVMPDFGRNELGRLIEAMRKMQAGLLDLVSRIMEAAQQVDVSSRELALGNLNLSQRTEESAASLEQTVGSMEKLTATVKLNAENAQQAHQLACNVSATAATGAEVVNCVTGKMHEIAESANHIANILSVIDGIAFQTNILALNASVEAARAGEQGRGFAVVASEVRNLAQRSAESAKEIRQLISESQGRVNEGSELAQRAGETMNAIAKEVKHVTDLMREISGASLEQNHGIEQVNQAVNQMDGIARQNAALVEQATAATRSLEEQSRELVNSMSQFQVNVEK